MNDLDFVDFVSSQKFIDSGYWYQLRIIFSFGRSKYEETCYQIFL